MQISANPSKRPTSVDEYLAGVPPKARVALARLRKMITAAAPGSSVVISYRVPIVRHEGRQLVGFAAFRDHCSFFVMSPEVIRAHAAALKGYDVAKGTVRFTPNRPLPASLVRMLVKARIAENRALSAKREGVRGSED
jgi:uncharacterized protein YdhG (YjbR/CyaY superfamily)